MNKVVGVYNSVADANKAKSALEAQGYDNGSLKVIDQSGENGGSKESVWQEIKSFFGGSSDYDDKAHDAYTRHVSTGGALLAVTVPESRAAATADLLYSQGAVDIQGDDASDGTGIGYDNTDYAGNRNVATDATDTTGQQAIPIVQEDLVVGKRQVNRGGVRVYSHTVSEAASADVNLHDERIVVDRRPVDRAATDADFSRDGVIELTATGEEAVVGKTSRVVEEVLVGKQGSDHTQHVSDNVRHTEVEVERIEGTDADRTDLAGTKTDRY